MSAEAQRLNRYLAACGLGLAARGRGARGGRARHDRRRRRRPRPGSACPRARTSRSTARPVAPDAHAYVLLHKPADVVTTVRDTHGRRTVIDLVGADRRLFPVGPARRRHDGPAPAHERRRAGRAPDASRATASRRPTRRPWSAPCSRETAARLAAGIELDGRRTAPARVRVLRASGQAERRRDRAARGPQAPGAAHVRGGRPPRALAAPLGLRRPAARRARAGRLAAAATLRSSSCCAARRGEADVAATRLNRYLALAGLGTRRERRGARARRPRGRRRRRRAGAVGSASSRARS